MGHEIVFIFTASSEACVLVCLSTIDFPHNIMYTIVTIINDFIAGSIIIIYAIIPFAAALKLKVCFKQIESNVIVLNFDHLKIQLHQFIVRLRLISGIYIACYLISMVPGMIICDVLLGYFTSTNSVITFSLICNFCVVFNSVLPFYIWLFDTGFRGELCSVLTEVACCFKESFNFEINPK